MFSIVMMSCDKYKCLTNAFNKCLDKYYSNHPVIHYIYGDDCWTKRLREGLQNIEEEYVLFFLDDMLLRKEVNENLIQDALTVLQNDSEVAVVNFEQNYRVAHSYSNNWLKQKKNQMYLHSCQPSLWRKAAFIEALAKDENAWQWEMTYINDKWDYLINTNNDIIDVGRTNDLNWGIARGRLTDEFKQFLIKENIYSTDIKSTFNDIKLSIITPYYKVITYTLQLAKTLVPQLTDEVEWIIVDDGCHEKRLDDIDAKIIHLENNSGGASVPRNIGLDNAKGKYITFIDADDMVSDNYISKIMDKINNTNFDYCYISWRSQRHENNIIIEEEPPIWNVCVWNCIYSKDIIGNNRFDPELKVAEDYKFNVAVKHGHRENITDVLYYYNNTMTDSLSAKYL